MMMVNTQSKYAVSMHLEMFWCMMQRKLLLDANNNVGFGYRTQSSDSSTLSKVLLWKQDEKHQTKSQSSTLCIYISRQELILRNWMMMQCLAKIH
jgi:hypothetical protein